MNHDEIFDVDLGRFRPDQIPRRWIIIILLILAILLLFFSTFYQIQPEEIGVVLRFGRFVRITEPGLNMKIPAIEEVLKVPVQRQLKQEFGFRTTRPGVRSDYGSRPYLEESLMLTGDLNVAVVEWIVQYRVADPYKYLFKVRNLDETFRYMNEAVMRQVVGDRTVTEVLTVGRQEIEVTARDLLQELCDQYETGIAVDQVVLQDVNPPDPVKPSWDEVNQAQQQRDRLINEAQADYNQVIPRARGEAEQLVLQAEGYASERVNRARGEAARFISLHEAYRRAPEVTRRRLYYETFEDIIPKLGGKLYLDPAAEGVVPLIPLDQLRKILPDKPTGGAQ